MKANSLIRHRFRAVLGPWLLLLSTSAFAASDDPDSARIVTEDIPRFFEAFEEAAPDFDAGVFQRLYLDRATPGLEDFIQARIESAEQLAENVRAHSGYYASMRESVGRIADYERAIRAAFYALEYLYPPAVYPDVYCVIGRMNSGGTTSMRGLLIGADMYGKTPDTPLEELGEWHRQVLKPIEDIPHIIAHELIHYEQDYPDGPRTLLSACIKEGSADFLAELISGRHINAHVHEWANPREAELWAEFESRRGADDYAGWLYGGDSSDDRPADLGYWIGYKIAAAYYARAADKRAAVRDILEIRDFEAFLEQSGYGDAFGD